MAISKATLTAIHKTGVMTQNLQVALRAEAKKYADRLSKALSDSADGNVFDLLEGPQINNWKGVGKLSKMVEGIEKELIAVMQFATELVADAQKVSQEIQAASAPQPVAAASKKAPAKGKASVAASKQESNPSKLLSVLTAKLNSDEFTILTQTEIAKAAGIPMGSITATIKRLATSGAIELNADGTGYKLASQAPSDKPKKSSKAKANVEMPAPVVASAPPAPAKKAAAKKATTKKPAATTIAADKLKPKAKKAVAEKAVAKKAVANEAAPAVAANAEPAATTDAPVAVETAS